MLLALVGVAPDDIASDYELSFDRMRPFYEKLGEDDQGPLIEESSSARTPRLGRQSSQRWRRSTSTPTFAQAASATMIWRPYAGGFSGLTSLDGLMERLPKGGSGSLQTPNRDANLLSRQDVRLE